MRMIVDEQNHNAYEKNEESDKNTWMIGSHIIIVLFIQKITDILYRVINVFYKTTSILSKLLVYYIELPVFS